MIYAIDFGTSNSLLGLGTAEKSATFKPVPLDPHAKDPSVLRTLIYFPNTKQAYYGAEAIQEFIKRDMEGRLIRSVKKHLPVRSFVGTYIEDRPINLEDIISFFLGEMRRRANAHFDRDVDSVVLGRPARFSDDDTDDQFAQYRLERAAKQAGFKHVEFCPEPLAAAFAFRETLREPKTVLVSDLGGGTSDFTVIRIGPQDYQPSDVLAIGGVSIAGDALDGEVMRRRLSPHFGADVTYQVPFGSNVLTMPRALMEKICSPADISVLRKRETIEFFKNVKQWSLGSEDRRKMDRLFCLIEDQLGFELFERIEAVKRTLSGATQAEFRFDHPEIALTEPISQKEFEAITQEKVERILKSLDDTVQAAGIRFEDVDLVCATGGTAKVPAIQRALEARFGREKIQEHNHFHSVVQGLTARARQLLT